MKKFLIMIILLFPYFSVADNPDYTKKIIYLASNLAQVKIEDYNFLFRSMDERLKNSVDETLIKYDDLRGIVSLKKEEIKPIIDYIFDSAVQGTVKNQMLYTNRHGIGSDKYAKLELTDGVVLRTKEGDYFVSKKNDTLYLCYSKVGSKNFNPINKRLLNLENNYKNEDHLKSTCDYYQSRTDQHYIFLDQKGGGYGLTNCSVPFSSFVTYEENYPGKNENAFFYETIGGTRYSRNLKKEDIISVYNPENYKNALIYGDPKASYSKIDDAINSIFPDEFSEVEFRIVNSDFNEDPELNDFFNDPAEGFVYKSKINAVTQNDNSSGLNFDWLRELIGSIIETTQSIFNSITGIPDKLGEIYNSISSMFDTTQFVLSLDPLKVNFMDRFPFCIPKDLLKGLKLFNSTMSSPDLTIKIDTQYLKINHKLDLGLLNYVRGFFRYLAVAWYSIFLILRTRDLIKW